MVAITIVYIIVLNIVIMLIFSVSTATTGGTTGSGGLNTIQGIDIGVRVGGTLLTVLVMILVATGIFQCRKRCRGQEQQSLLDCKCECVCVHVVYV